MGDAMEIEVVSAIQLPDVERMRNFGGAVPFCSFKSHQLTQQTLQQAHVKRMGSYAPPSLQT